MDDIVGANIDLSVPMEEWELEVLAKKMQQYCYLMEDVTEVSNPSLRPYPVPERRQRNIHHPVDFPSAFLWGVDVRMRNTTPQYQTCQGGGAGCPTLCAPKNFPALGFSLRILQTPNARVYVRCGHRRRCGPRPTPEGWTPCATTCGSGRLRCVPVAHLQSPYRLALCA